MSIFEQRNKLFDIEHYKGKNQDPLIEAQAELRECANKNLQDFKFRKLQNKFNSSKLANYFIKNEPDSALVNKEILPNLKKYKQSI